MKSIGFICIFSGICPLLGTPVYTVTDLGTLGGGSAITTAINNSGVAVGWSMDYGGVNRAFLNNGKGILPLPGATGQAAGINAAGTVAGTVFEFGGAQAGVWLNGNFQSFGTLGGSDAYGMGINDSGAAVGSSSLATGQSRAFLYNGNTMASLGVLAEGGWSAAYGINNAGEVAGTSETSGGAMRAFRWTPGGGMVNLGTLGGSDSWGMGINGAGSIVGASATASGYLHGFLHTGGAMLDLGTLGGPFSYAYGLNSSNVAVGYSYGSAFTGTHAFAWMDGIMYDLNTLLDMPSGWELTAAHGINDAGQIVGTGRYNGEDRAFRLDPASFAEALYVSGFAAEDAVIATPEPTATLLVTGGLIVMGAIPRKRRKL